MAAERASARAAQPPATEPMREGGGPEEAWADDNQRIMTSDSFLPKKPVIMQLSADLSESLTQAAQTPKETKRLSSRSAPARSTPARHSKSAAAAPAADRQWLPVVFPVEISARASRPWSDSLLGLLSPEHPALLPSAAPTPPACRPPRAHRKR